MHWESKEEMSSEKLPQSQNKTTKEYLPASETETKSISNEEGFMSECTSPRVLTAEQLKAEPNNKVSTEIEDLPEYKDSS